MQMWGGSVENLLSCGLYLRAVLGAGPGRCSSNLERCLFLGGDAQASWFWVE